VDHLYDHCPPQTGTYTLNASVAYLGQGGTFHIEFNGVDKTGPMTVPDTGGWESWTTISKQVSLTQGTQTMKIVMDSGGVFGSIGDITTLTFTQSGGPTQCAQYTPSTSIPTGFGSPYDVAFSPSTNLIQTTCSTNSVTVNLGNQNPLTYMYNTGYLYKQGLTTWQAVNYTSTESLISNAWYPKSATATISMTSTELANPSYVPGYLCTWTGSSWKCGCRDSACTQSYWQIQSFKR
jgi:Carbohydrate binding module (family 6)